MAVNNYSITFVSLRSSTTYTLEITGGSGAFIPLKGGAQPFSTHEDDDEDQFAPIRTQSGTIRIVDDGKDANGNALGTDWWKDLAPVNDTERPVTLRANGVIHWQGFMQAQNFGGTLYGNPQEREFPVQCCLSVLAATQVSTTQSQLNNLAFLLKYIFDSVPSHSFSTYYFQGGVDARSWLLKRFDWHNFLTDGQDEDLEPKYNLFEVLEDVCRFWGWTARTWRNVVYFTCADDAMETRFLELSQYGLNLMANGTASGDTVETYISDTISGDVFASINNDDFKQRGPNKATVKSDVNDEDTLIEFAPPSVEKKMDESGYSWVKGEEAGTGYFTTTLINVFETNQMSGSAGYKCGFCRRQIFEDPKSDKPSKEDMMVFEKGYSFGSSVVTIATEKAINFTGGSLKLSGDLFVGAKRWSYSDGNDFLYINIGIGASIQSAKWFDVHVDNSGTNFIHTWGNNRPSELISIVSGGTFNGIACVYYPSGVITTAKAFAFDAIPCDANDLYGRLFIEIIGMKNDMTSVVESFEVGNLKLAFTRDQVFFPSSTSQPRPRTMSEERETSQKYMAMNNNQTHEEWNADCIFASDNNMKYGYGLLINTDGTFMKKAQYNGVANAEYPEQHLANRVASYWSVSRRRMGVELRANTRTTNGTLMSSITPRHLLTIDGTKMHPVAISREWRDDVVILSMLEMP